MCFSEVNLGFWGLLFIGKGQGFVLLAFGGFCYLLLIDEGMCFRFSCSDNSF